MLNHLTKFYFGALLFLFIAGSASAQIIEKWPEATQSSKPWTRWWWMGNAVDSENIKRELTEFNELGIGGVEITPIYGVKGEEENFIEFLSPEFSDAIEYTITEANKLGMGVDLPAGSGWRNGGPFVPKEKGLWNLSVSKYEVKAGEKWELDEDVKNAAAISFVSEGKTELLTTKSYTAKSDGTIYLALRIKSGDKVKRPSKGGEGWAIDTFNEVITNWYLKEFWERLGIQDATIRCFFHDSFEYTGDFTTNFLEEFKKRRKYDLAAYLHVLAGDCTDKDIVARVKSDYRETLADLVLESFIQPMTTWTNKHKSLNRNQAHGSPGNILDLYAACDIPETEFFGRLKAGEPEYYIQKFASSAAHVTGKKLVSSESYTWLDEHWTVTPTDMMRATNDFFLAGINHMFFHGTCYSPKDDVWPGWLFYASTQLNNRNPIWQEMPTLFKYIERTQTILQQATPLTDVLVYWPYYDVAAGEGRLFNHIGVNKVDWFYEEPIAALSEQLDKKGYTFDFISDKQILDCKTQNGKIVSSGSAKYKAIVIPECLFIPVKTMQKLNAFIAEGGKVVFDKKLPKSVPGLNKFQERQIELNDLKTKFDKKWVGNVPQILSENEISGEMDLLAKGFQYLKMKMDSDNYYWIFNVDSVSKNEWVELGVKTKNYVFMNPMNGEITEANSKAGLVRVQLEPEQAILIKCTNLTVAAPQYLYKEKTDIEQEIGALWKIEFVNGGPVYPGNLQTDELRSWTDLGDYEAQRFAGTVKYSTVFNWSGEAKSNVLNLGVVKDCARVYLNGENLGTLLGPTYNIRTDKLVKGNNKLVIEVTNVAANRIRDLDMRGVNWRKFHDINLVNIDYEAFDASGWEIRKAGLLGPVTISYSSD